MPSPARILISVTSSPGGAGAGPSAGRPSNRCTGEASSSTISGILQSLAWLGSYLGRKTVVDALRLPFERAVNAAAARRAVRAALDRWKLAHLADDALLVTTE